MGPPLNPALGESRTEMEIKSGEGKWSGKVENGWEERGRAVLKIPLKYPGLGPTIITVMCSRHRYRLLARCAIHVPHQAGYRDVSGVKPMP